MPPLGVPSDLRPGSITGLSWPFIVTPKGHPQRPSPSPVFRSLQNGAIPDTGRYGGQHRGQGGSAGGWSDVNLLPAHCLSPVPCASVLVLGATTFLLMGCHHLRPAAVAWMADHICNHNQVSYAAGMWVLAMEGPRKTGLQRTAELKRYTVSKNCMSCTCTNGSTFHKHIQYILNSVEGTKYWKRGWYTRHCSGKPNMWYRHTGKEHWSLLLIVAQTFWLSKEQVAV